jgi:hypothetical protein
MGFHQLRTPTPQLQASDCIGAELLVFFFLEISWQLSVKHAALAPQGKKRRITLPCHGPESR